MATGCLMCNNLYLYRYLNMTRRCPFCYLIDTSLAIFESFVQMYKVYIMKTVVLGDSTPRSITVLEDKRDPGGLLEQTKAPGMQKSFGSSAKAPRKTVSINHNVEFIDDYLSNKRKRKAMQQWPSMEIEGDTIKPLKSILKVGSKQI